MVIPEQFFSKWHTVPPSAKASQASPNTPGSVAMRLGQKSCPSRLSIGLLKKCTGESFKSGETIIHEGEEGDEIFYLERGKASVFMTVNGQAAKFRPIDKNQFFGEIAVLGDGIRTAHCYCRGRHLLINLTSPGFRKIEKGISDTFLCHGRHS